MTRTRIPAFVAVVLAVAMTGSASGQPGDLFELRAGGNLDWTPTSGAIIVSSGSKLTASGVLTSPFGNAAYDEAAGPGVARTSIVGSFTNPQLETRRLDPTTFARATTRLTVSGPDGVVNVRLKAHVDATVLHACPASFLCGSSVTVFVGDHNTAVIQPGGADPNFLGLAVDAVPGGYRVHGDYVSPLRPVVANSAFDAILSIQLGVNNFGRGTADSSSFDARAEVSFPATGTVLEVPAGYAVSGENVEDNHWTDPFAPPATPEIELRFADGTPIGSGDVVDLGTIASGATSAPTSFAIANTGAAALHVQPLVAPPAFAVVEQPKATVASGGATTAGLTCSAMNTGFAPLVLEESVTVASDDPDEGSIQLQVRCSVLPDGSSVPDVELQAADGTTLAQPATLDLGDVMTGQTATVSYRIANTGTAPLIVTSVTNDAPPGHGSSSGPATSTVAPGASTPASVFCGGVNEGDFPLNVVFRVRVFSNDTDESPADLLVRCHVVPTNPDVELRYNDGTPIGADDVIELGPVAVGEDSNLRSIRVYNVGDAGLHWDASTGTNVNFTDFGSGGAVAPGQFETAFFRCRGTGHTFDGTLRILSDDPDEPSVSVGLRCLATPPTNPDVELRYNDGTPIGADDVIELGPVAAGEDAIRSIRVYNVGDAGLHWDASTGTNPDFTDFFSGGAVAPGQFETAFFGCTGIGRSYDGTLRILSDDPDEPSVSVALRCLASDETPPSVVGKPDRAPNGAGWYNAPVTIDWRASDDSGSATDPPDTVAATNGADVTYVSGQSCDAAGNCATGSLALSIDRVAPTVTCEATPTFLLGAAGATVAASVSDAHSGAASATVQGAANTATVGARATPLSGRDLADNAKAVQCPYNVAYAYTGFLQPVDNGGTLNVVKAGKAIPLKWRITSASGAPITTLTAATITAQTLACSSGMTADLIEETTTGGSGLQNLGDGYYQLNWKSPASYADSCKTVRLDLGEGIYRTALFRFIR